MKDLIPHPIHDIVQLPSLRSVKVSQIQLKYSLYSLLSDPEMLNTTNSLIHDPSYRKPSFHNTPQNLDVPRNNSTDDESKYIFEIHHGYSFVMAHQQFCHARTTCTSCMHVIDACHGCMTCTQCIYALHDMHA